MNIRIYLCLILLLVLSEIVIADQTPVLKRTAQAFDPTVPTLQSVLGYDLGERITGHAEMERYLRALDEYSPRLLVKKIGESYEGRSLYYVIISSEENLSRLDQLRTANLRLAEPRTTSRDEAEEIIRSNPVFVALSYAVHGNEHSSTEAAMALAYYLLAAQDPEVTRILSECVIILDPLQNPDGRERFVHYFRSTVGFQPNPDLDAAEHNETWPSGRYNHYLFDMNRDWIVLSQKETQHRIAAYREFQPQIFIDLHEMGENSSYFFPPPTLPHNPNLPKNLQEWWRTLGKAVADAFDRHNIDYYTEEVFDFWYPGYGDSWPTYNGALTGTFEQASVRGLVARRRDGVLVHYQDAIWHHFLSSLATCKMAAEKRKEKLRDFYQFRASAVQEGKKESPKYYIISRKNDPYQADRLAAKLLQHGVEVERARSSFREKSHGYFETKEEKRNFEAGDYIIRLQQPLKRLIKASFEKETLPDKTFLEAEERRRKDKEPSEFYDITAWAFPLAYGLDVFWSSDIDVETDRITEAPRTVQEIPQAHHAYLLNYNSNQSIWAVLQLLQRNVRVYFTRKSFKVEGQEFLPGSFIIKVKENSKDLHKIITDISRQTGAQFLVTHTSWTEEGPDIGSNNVIFLEKPSIAVAMDYGVSPTSYGAIYYTMEQLFRSPFTPLQTSMISSAELKKYNVLIFPDEGWGSYSAMLGSEEIETLKRWMENGGTLIALQGAASFLIEEGTLTDAKRITRFVRDSAEPIFEKEKENEEEESPSEEEMPPSEEADFIPGSIALANLNLKHFLGFGYRTAQLPVFINSSNIFVVGEDAKMVAAYAPAEKLRLAGVIWDIAKRRLEKKAYLLEQPIGDGHLILFAEDPNFRSYWEGLTRLFMNGVLFGPSH